MLSSEDFEKIRTNMAQKLGEESMALISDDISTLMLENNDANSQIATRDKEIAKLKTDKENLINTNGNLLQKISMESKAEQRELEKEPTNKKQYSLSSAFEKTEILYKF